MGNASPSLKGLDIRFEQLGTDDNELLSTLIVVKDSSTQEKLLVKQINIASETDYSRLLKQLRQRKVISTKKIGKHLLRVRDVQGRQQSEICGKSFKILIYLEYVSGSLKTVFQERLRTRRCYEEDELMSLMKSVVSGLIMLHDNNFKNIHLCKESVLVTCENTYKIMDTQLCNRIHPFFEVLNGVPPKSGTYLAPQLLNDIAKETVEFYQTPKADLFTLAVIVLELATLKSMDPYYDYENKKVDVNGLHQNVQQLPMSPNIKRILHDMLKQHEEERIGLLSLKETLSGGVQTQPNEELYAFNSMSQISNAKQSARTFISLSKNASRPQSTQQPSKDNSIKMPANQQISQYISQMQHKISQPQSLNPFNKVQFQSVPVQPSYIPIEANTMNRPLNISVSTMPLCPIKNQVILQTPKSQMVHELKIINTRQFDTPVNFLLQHCPQSGPSNIQIKQNKGEEPVKQKVEIMKVQGSSKTDMISSKAISSKSEIVYSKNQIFNNKSYGQMKFSNGARYEGQFNQQGQFEGNGILYYPNGKPCYSGSWKNNSFHGFGVLHNQHPVQNNSKPTPYWEFKLEDIDWLYYEGEFSLDKKEGFGTLYMANGDKFSGCFKDDTIEGFGSFFNSKQQKNINGIWINNVLKH